MPAKIAGRPGAKLRAAREAREITRTALAGRIGVTVGRLGDIETDRKPLELGTIDRIALAIGCDPHSIDDRLSPLRLRGR